MPTYRSVDISASLCISELDETLSDVLNLRMGAEQMEDARRIQRVLDAGTTLREMPIGADGSEKGVLQFIGTYEDLPLLVVETCQDVGTNFKHCHTKESKGAPTERATPPPKAVASSPARDVTDSPLTSLGQTPSLDTPNAVIRPNMLEHRDIAMSDASNEVVGTPPQPFPNFAQASAYIGRQSSSSALMLTVELGRNTQPVPAPGSKNEKLRDGIKIEVFLNGVLADVAFVNLKRSSVQIGTDGKARFCGTRISRQSEKPWVYQSYDTPGSVYLSAEERWTRIGQLLEKEAAGRGQDEWGILPPTAEYLKALAHVPLPSRLVNKGHLGLLDIVVTTGKGRKLGPETSYMTSPTRMRSLQSKAAPMRKATAPPCDNVFSDDPFQADTAKVGDKRRGILPMDVPPLPSTSPDASLAKRTRSGNCETRPVKLELSPYGVSIRERQRSFLPKLGSTTTVADQALNNALSKTAASPSSANALSLETTRAFATELRIPLDKLTLVQKYESRSKHRSKGRTLTQRLGDIRQMGTAKRQRAVQQLVDQFATQAPTSPTRPSPKRSKPNSERAITHQPRKIDDAELATSSP